MTRALLLVGVAAVAATALPTDAGAQLLDRMKRRAQQQVERRIEDKTARAVDKGLDTVECAATDAACIKKAKDEGKTVVAPGTSAAAGASAASPTAAAPAAAAPAAGRPGEGAWANYDFVPGERVLLAEDFTKDRVGDFPRRLELLNGNMEIVEWQGQRWLRVTGDGAFELPLPEQLPERFTLEFDLTLPWGGMWLHGAEYVAGSSRSAAPTSVVFLGGTEAGIYRGKSSGESVVDPRGLLPTLSAQYEKNYLSAPLRVRMQADGRYVKVYLNEVRVANMPNANFARRNALVFEFAQNGGAKPEPPLISNISVNAGGKDLYDALTADGRVATQGILFDTGSDVLRPESTPTLTQIGEMLAEHAELKLTIEGHTDNVGDAAANRALSEQRAAAVKAYLVSKHGVSADRLQAVGHGDAKPAAPNATAEGRAQNRRVELVKM